MRLNRKPLGEGGIVVLQFTSAKQLKKMYIGVVCLSVEQVEGFRYEIMGHHKTPSASQEGLCFT